MATHPELLGNMPLVARALRNRYAWFIHTTYEQNLDGIRRGGLELRAPCACSTAC